MDAKKLREISSQLKKASAMHKAQAVRLTVSSSNQWQRKRNE